MSYHLHGGDIYRHQNVTDFSANCNPFGTPESVKQAAVLAMEEVCNYPDTCCQELREAIGAYEGVNPDWILCGNGAADLIFRLVLGEKPKKALLPAPVFAEYEQALETAGCQVQHYFLKEENGFLLDEGFLAAIEEGVDMVFVCNPNNPTGVLTRRELLLRILEKCRERNCLLVLDECFVDFVEEPEAHTLKECLDRSSNLFLLKAFTKRYAMAGVRLGYGLCSNPGILERAALCGQPWSVSTIAQKAGVAALKEEAYVARTMQVIRKERCRMLEEMKKAGYITFASSANYIFFKGPKDLYENCLKAGFLIRDCSNYHGLEKGYYRIAVKLRKDNDRLLRVLARYGKEG